METKMITIPFEVELAQKIQAGEHPGKIVARNGFDARVVCWDKKGENDNIVALIKINDKQEACCTLKNDGFYYKDNSPYCFDLLLQVPEWSQYKDGDVLACEVHTGPKDYCKWFAILKGEVHLTLGKIEFIGYVSYNYDSTYEAGKLAYDELTDNIHYIRLATEEEKEIFVKRMKEEETKQAKKYLKRFFGIEEKPMYEFQPFQQVLVKYEDGERWKAAFFSHYDEGFSHPYWIIGTCAYKYCIPYNEKTKYLLGTIDNWEEE